MAKLFDCIDVRSGLAMLELQREHQFEQAIARDRMHRKHDEKLARHSRLREQYEVRPESTRTIFAACKGQSTRKRQRTRIERSSGSITIAVRVGTYTACVCKHRVAL